MQRHYLYWCCALLGLLSWISCDTSTSTPTKLIWSNYSLESPCVAGDQLFLEQRFQAAAMVYEKALPPVDSIEDRLYIIQQIAMAYLMREELDKAIPWLEEAKAMQSRELPLIARADFAHLQGRYWSQRMVLDSSFYYLFQARDAYQQAGPQHHYRQAQVMAQLAFVHFDWGLHIDSITYYAELSNQLMIPYPEHLWEAELAMACAKLYQLDYKGGVFVSQAVVDQMDALPAPLPIVQGRAYSFWGSMLKKEGDRLIPWVAYSAFSFQF